MDDNEHVCPLCCEELDISDRQFFPCKCGYQVCMWCWHRIRESESGLCPACRTPYGDDPHEFSAVDVEEVLKANKEKEAAAKRERQRQQSDGNSSDGEGIGSSLAGMKGQMEVPRDRTQLANMRVIRRNLVYAVGLPPTIASEDILRKPDYFGQYGRISKIVLNRSQTTGGDLRRASASAYVTFAYKEDTLASILAMDGFYLDGRNIRASYGTSKYCSAFIKNVRCNNPECTYLHQMGDVEDTFTKQEIQAGYVTSGRDVLARQQQIVQQALSAASGAAGSTPRRKIGGGGPSSTGKAASNPVFPPPAYDEPARPSTANLVPPPQTAPARPNISGAAFPTISAANAAVAAAASSGTPAPSSVARNASSGSVGSAGSFGPTPKGSIGLAAQGTRKGVIGGQPPANAGPAGATAASVVAGVHSVSGNSEPPAPHTTLTPLTPLKRVPSKNEATKLTTLRTGTTRKANGTRPIGSAPGSPASDAPLAGGTIPARSPNRPDTGISSIGGTVIAAPASVPPAAIGGMNGLASDTDRLADLGGDALGGLGGEVFNGPLKSSGHSSAIGAPIGSGNDLWNSSSMDPVLPQNSGGLWAGGSQQPHGPPSNVGQIGGGAVGTIGGGFHNSGSSALASMLGINLPTGSGSLQESSNLWGGTAGPNQQHPAPISALNGSSVPMQGVIGPGGPSAPGNGLIGGVTIGGGQAPLNPGTIGGGGNKNDIALLQSLLPGVHITSGGTYSQEGSFGSIGGQMPPQRVASGGNPAGPHQPHQGQHWQGGLQSGLGGQPVGAIGQGVGGAKQNQRQAPGSIW